MPRGRGRGGRGGATKQVHAESTQSNSGSKIQLQVRESFPPTSLQGFLSPTLQQIDDSIPIVPDILPVKLRGKSVNIDTGYTLISFNTDTGILHVKENGIPKEVIAHQKKIALMDPYRWMRYKERPNQPFYWIFQNGDVQAPENQGYIDCVASSLVTTLSTMYRSPHFCKFYGAFRAVTDKFLFSLEDDFDDFRYTEWFWKAIDANEFGLRVVERTTKRVLTKEEVQELMRPDPEFLEDEQSDDETEDSDSSSSVSSIDGASIDAESLPSVWESSVPDTPHCTDLEEVTSLASDGQIQIGSKQASSEDSDSSSFEDLYEIHAELYNMPIAVMFLEKQTATMDDMLEMTEFAPIQTKEQTEKWLAWIFQVCVACSQYQNGLHCTHNDLHTNNILWKRTDQEYLYYKSTKGTVYKVPTYGYIFSIIDYGRAIFTIKGFTYISSDYNDGHDASGMYNFGCILDETQPKVYPNRSFDLCRLSCCLVRALFPVNPEGLANRAVLTKEEGLIVRETANPVFNLIWSWLKTTDGDNVMETFDGDEKYYGFDLYIAIASMVHNANPTTQLTRPIFQQFVQTSLPAGIQSIMIPV
jgi:hypothetical protein